MGVVARNDELEAGRRFLAADGGVRALVLDGEAGVGKTTVWRALADEARALGATVLECRPVAAEATYAFASLADLLAPVADRLAPGLPEPQRVALDAALLRAAPARGRVNGRAVAAATHSLVLAGAAEGTVVLAVDDAQWLDSASAGALAFALRRLRDAPVRLLAAFRLERPPLPDPLDLDRTLEGRVERLRLEPFTLSGLYHLLND